MINFKSMPPNELWENYNTRLGFVFHGASASSDDSIERLCNTLIQHNITTELPEFIVRFSDSDFAAVYGDNFDSPAFFQRSDIAERLHICKVESLFNASKRPNTNEHK